MPKKKVFHDDSDEEDSGFEILTIDKPKQPERTEESDSEDEANRLLADSDSDSAPEDVDFLSSKTTALQRVKYAVQQIEAEKTKQKDKRKKLDTLYKEQKKQKLQALERSRLPDDLLEDIAATPPPKLQKKSSKSKEDKSHSTEEEEDRLSDTGSNDDDGDALAATEDFIPLSGDKDAAIQAVCLYEQLRKPRSSAQKAAEFRQKMLYRSSVPRESTRSMLARKKKKRPL